MVCKTVRLPNGGYAIVKLARPHKQRCHFVGNYGRNRCKEIATLQCDWPTKGGETCSVYMCRQHSRQHQSYEHGKRDFCLYHVDPISGLEMEPGQ